MRVLVTGADGQLGGELVRQLGPQAIALGREKLDITNAQLVERVIQDVRPDAVVNCAAYTNVDQAEIETDACFATNGHALAHLANACRGSDCLLVQMSTDYVFGGDTTRRTPYREDDAPAPPNAYGHSKLLGEHNAAGCDQHITVRTCGLYGPSSSGNNFVDKILRRAEGAGPLRVVEDQVCTPTYVPHLARAVLFVLERRHLGKIHIVNGDSTTWYHLAAEVLRSAERRVRVEPISSEEFAAMLLRPSYSVLDTTRYRELGGPALPGWRQAIAEYLRAKRT